MDLPSSPVESNTPNALQYGEDLESELATSVLRGNAHRVRSLIGTFNITLSHRYSWVLYEACLRGPKMIQAFLVDPEINLDTVTQGSPLLHHVLNTPQASFVHDKEETVRFLLKCGADPLQCDRLGNSTLHHLSSNIVRCDEHRGTEGYRLMHLLLVGDESLQAAAREGIDAQNRYGDTPLTLALMYDHMECLQLLLEYGANPFITGEFGKSPLDFAQERGDSKVVGLMLRAWSRVAWPASSEVE
ncbi:hypothetical protein INS49_014039 [Diaporthe citri]|uniref:uncharacterized protein n=1 Tax=Diaporthe citri TaxID=83186 RepID=UPI001C7F884C|nr:uncharacterized protein INS49_014039 [Diaporthe citri]KAG6358155.1 hypothetical protein INS49_014039 [Diaporthe citri]